MRIILKIARTELATLFYSPIAWFILILFSIIAGSNIIDIVHRYTEALELSRSTELPYSMTVSVFCGSIGFLSVVADQIFLYIPLLTMGLISREKSSGSIKLLLSSPLTTKSIVFGKYIGAATFGLLLMIVPVISIIFTSSVIPNFDWGIALSGLLGLIFMVLSYCAVGLFMSSLTVYQVVAAVGTLAILAGLNYIGSVGQEYDFIREITYWLSVKGRTHDLFTGVIRSADIFYFIIVIGIFLSLTIMRLRFERITINFKQKFIRYALLFCIVFMCGYLTSLPSLSGVYDTTNNKSSTITENSRKFVSQLEGEVTVTNYINLFDSKSKDYLPNSQLFNRRFLEQYRRAKPDLKERNVFYYARYTRDVDMMTDEKFITSLEERRDDICFAYNFSPSLFKSINEIDEDIDLRGEEYGFVRIIEDSKGNRIRLRDYNDLQRVPSEIEITATLKKMISEPYKVAFISGHNERSINSDMESDYKKMSQKRDYRHSLDNQGFTICEIDLSKDEKIGDDIKIVVLADPKSEISSSAKKELENYIDRGGNMLILADNGRQKILNPLLKKLSLEIEDGVLLHKDDNLDANIILSKAVGDLSNISDGFARTFGRGYLSASMQNSVAIGKIEGEEFKLTPILQTAPSVWVDKDYSFDSLPEYSVERGEKMDNYTTIWAAERDINNKAQRILVIGDADLFSNSEIDRMREGFIIGNNTLMLESFRWLSHEEYPITVVRPTNKDNTFTIKTKQLSPVKALFYGILPAIMLLIAVGVWLKRRRG